MLLDTAAEAAVAGEGGGSSGAAAAVPGHWTVARPGYGSPGPVTPIDPVTPIFPATQIARLIHELMK